MRILASITLCVMLLGLAIPAFAADHTPLLMDGKKTLYQRVLTRPGASLKREPGDGPGAQQPAMTRLYVYSRKAVGDKTWLEVGLTAKGHADGWLQDDVTLPWNQQMALAFTNPAGRERSLLFKERKDLQPIVEADKPDTVLSPLRKAALSGKGDPRVVAVEPETYVDISKHFYLLPIIQAEETLTGSGNRVRVLQVASVSAQDESKKPAADAKDHASVLRNFSASVVFVVDSTISMNPYIDRVRAAVKRIYDRVGKAGLNDRVKFGLVAFRSNIQAVPKLDYVSKVYADPTQVKDGNDFLARVADVKAASVSSARVDEDSYSGVMTALTGIDWTRFGGRYVVLITDAGSLKGNDPLSGTHLDAEQIRLEAQHRGVALYALHLRTDESKPDHAGAEAQYKALTTHPLLSQPLYYPVEGGSVEGMGQMVDTLADAIVDQVNAAYRGESVAGSATTADASYTRATAEGDKAKAKAKDSSDRLRRDAAMLGYAMQLAYLGRTEGTTTPPLFNAWISDRDLAKPEVPTTEVRVLLTKNQLSDMQQVLQSILKVGQAAQLSPNDFFAKMRSAAAVLGRDPNAINNPNATKLADLGLMGEYLDGLPYRSKILDIDQQLWSSWSISQQQAFLDEVQRKLRLYQIYHDDVDRWVALDGGADPGEAVYPVPLDALP
ncbi:vWA domain-containing protein [Magnetospirillum molischianum]|uniref:PpkA-related protein n=1 Tax=Magnetospirillum molischianum DSM 120 TaxID=1150626 RepID=H8FWQ8_MAGML|nr:vWA domain-containing protein [Magnetospirillum molischianum]CCG42796.1 PpkA-related protein [Magnetospirillum molischianum DSM 120]